MAMTTETTPISPAATAEAYVSFWNLSADDQRVLGEALFTEGVGDYTFVARAEPDAHHRHVRVRWEIRKEEGSFAEGKDVLDLDESGRIAAITAFIDRAPDGFDPEAHHEEA